MAGIDVKSLLLEFESTVSDCNTKLQRLRAIESQMKIAISEYERKCENEISKCAELSKKLNLSKNEYEKLVGKRHRLENMQEGAVQQEGPIEGLSVDIQESQSIHETGYDENKHQYEQQKRPPFIENFTKFGIDLDNIDPSSSSWNQDCSVLERYPLGCRDDIPDIANYVFPNSGKIRCARMGSPCQPYKITTDDCHIFVTTDFNTGEKTYGFCVTFPQSYRQNELSFIQAKTCYCIRSKYPFFDLFFRSIRLIRDHEDSRDQIMDFLLKQKVPKNGDKINIETVHGTLKFERPKTDALCIIEWCSAVSWVKSSAETLLKLLQLCLTEQKIVVIGKPQVCSPAVLCLTAMTTPIPWNHALIPILPEHRHDLLGSPMPYLAGITELTEEIVGYKMDGVDAAFWFPETGKLTLPKGFEPSTDGDHMVPLLDLYLQQFRGFGGDPNPSYTKNIFNTLNSFVETAQKFIMTRGRKTPSGVGGLFEHFNVGSHMGLSNPSKDN